MRPSRFSDEQIRQAIAQVAAGTPLVTMCRKLGVTQTTFYRWRKKYDSTGMSGTDETRALKDENHKLKQIVAELCLERQLLLDRHGKHARPTRQSGG
jgi:putative transposase